MNKLSWLALIGFFPVLMVSACNSAPEAGAGGMQPPPIPVSIASAASETVPIQVRAVGNVEPYSSVGVKAQVSAQMLQVKFAEGANVKQGDLLFELDSRPFREALRQAEATLRKDEAELRVAQANLERDRARLKNAQAEAARFEQLSKEGISTRMREDEIRTNAQVAAQSVLADEASIESTRASLESSRAAIETAKLNLGYCEIRAPISGRTGNLLLHPGNLVQANSEMPLVVINQIAPIFIAFGVPERHIAVIASKQRSSRGLAVEVSPGEGAGEAIRGTLSVIDNQVDSTTGTIRLKATFENRNGLLWPGQFVNVILTLDTLTATVIPTEAIQSGQQGPFVYVVKPDDTVEPRPIQVGAEVSGRIVIEKGITAGERVVTDGQSRLFPGAKVSAAATAPAPGAN